MTDTRREGIMPPKKYSERSVRYGKAETLYEGISVRGSSAGC
jgi:hypothetical protein